MLNSVKSPIKEETEEDETSLHDNNSISRHKNQTKLDEYLLDPDKDLFELDQIDEELCKL